MSTIDVKEIARSIGLHDVFGDGQNWQSQEGKSVTLQDLEHFAAAVLLGAARRVLGDHLSADGLRLIADAMDARAR